MNYSTESDPACGPLLWRPGDHVIGVTGSPVDRRLIGSALQVASTEGGIAIWSIVVGDRELSGRWIVVGQEFLSKRGSGRLRR